jgi:hypothetical protein
LIDNDQALKISPLESKPSTLKETRELTPVKLPEEQLREVPLRIEDIRLNLEKSSP